MFLGIDFGLKRVGLAIAPEGGPAAPLEVIRWGQGMPIADLAALVRTICDVRKREGATTIVVGSPSVGSLASNSEQRRWRERLNDFVAALQEAAGVPVVTEDERMSTKLAGRLAGYKGVAESDAVAAAVILEGYLERIRNQE
jgi:RNase H-fold protein (predicted Holliday junction resolvase)